MDAIVDVQIERLKQRLQNRNITIILDNSAKTYLAEKGYDSIYGARPLKRVIQREIENNLAEEILRGKILDGDKVTISAKDTKIIFG